MNEHIGELHPTNDGKYFYKIIDWVDNTKVTVELLNDDFQPHYTRTATYQRIRGHLAYPGAEIHHPNRVDQGQLERKAYWEGRVVETPDGTAKYEIVDYQDAHNIKIHFLDTLCYQMRDSSSLDKNKVENPFPITDKGETVLYFGDPYKQYMGAYFYTTEGRRELAAGRMPSPSNVYRIIEYGGKDHIRIQFQDEFGYSYVTGLSDVTDGRVRNRYKYNNLTKDDIENMVSENLESLIFNKFRGMKDRVVNNPAYADTIISSEWNDYNAFRRWYIDAISTLNPKYILEYNVDKDLKYPYYASHTNGKKVYSPSTVVILPGELNVRIKYINDPSKSKSIADCAIYYYSENAITKEVYDMIMYQIARTNNLY